MLLMFKTKDNHMLRLRLKELQNSINLSNRYNQIVNSIVKSENDTTTDLLKSIKPKNGAQEVQKILNKILDVSKNNTLELDEKQSEIDKMKKTIEDIKQQNLRNNINETENINKTIELMTKTEPLLNYYYDNSETDEIRSFRNAEKRAEEIINTNHTLTKFQQDEIDELIHDLLQTRTKIITRGDATAFKNGTKEFNEILDKISRIKGDDVYSNIKDTENYLENSEEYSPIKNTEDNLDNDDVSVMLDFTPPRPPIPQPPPMTPDTGLKIYDTTDDLLKDILNDMNSNGFKEHLQRNINFKPAFDKLQRLLKTNYLGTYETEYRKKRIDKRASFTPAEANELKNEYVKVIKYLNGNAQLDENTNMNSEKKKEKSNKKQKANGKSENNDYFVIKL